MAYDAKLADRVREVLGGRTNGSEREQFGGVAFLVNGKVACGVIGNELLARVGPAQHDQAMKRKGAKPFSLGGRPPSRGWILVQSTGLKTPADLTRWVKLGMAFAKTLPSK